MTAEVSSKSWDTSEGGHFPDHPPLTAEVSSKSWDTSEGGNFPDQPPLTVCPVGSQRPWASEEVELLIAVEVVVEPALAVVGE